ncbi:hypothetical protein MAR_031388 [Mya arenaria]|uniref:Claudin n=1 Tax=Mya arenaria TaxID=6604 RepID=A0ABY7F6L7_MYAAR|nr:hypothetical protein MAR_031388 [Mya arenaria]
MGKDVLTVCGFVLSAASCLFTIISFATSHWLESFKDARTGFDNLGLWEACFNMYSYDRDSLGKTYDGCEWIFTWFVAVQVMMTLSMVLTLVTSILCLLGILNFCPPQRRPMVQLINSILMFASGIMLGLSVTVFGISSDGDRDWLPRPDQNYLSWSFGVAVVAGFFAIFAGMCLVIDSMRLGQIRRRQNAPPPYAGYKMRTGYPDY